MVNQNSAVFTSNIAEQRAEIEILRKRHEAVHADLPGAERKRVGLERSDDAGPEQSPRIGAMVKYWKTMPKAKAKMKSTTHTANIFSAKIDESRTIPR